MQFRFTIKLQLSEKELEDIVAYLWDNEDDNDELFDLESMPIVITDTKPQISELIEDEQEELQRDELVENENTQEELQNNLKEKASKAGWFSKNLNINE
ncbi:hypothetical protein FQA39_LY06966 [Lamprigera yunnana]|nr:hypothetical protein FQA39_LY06966 [Lamprigera yunnana]